MNTVGVKIWQLSLKSALIVYFSSAGNTQKVAYAIKDGLETGGLNVELKKPQETSEFNFYNYDLASVGSPSIERQPAKLIVDFVKAKLDLYHKPKKDQALYSQSRG